MVGRRRAKISILNLQNAIWQQRIWFGHLLKLTSKVREWPFVLLFQPFKPDMAQTYLYAITLCTPKVSCVINMQLRGKDFSSNMQDAGAREVAAHTWEWAKAKL